MKKKRQIKIIEIVNNEIIDTQEELAKRLVECGFNVTQATVSRDIRELNLTKITTEDGRQKYVAINTDTDDEGIKLSRFFSESVISIEAAQNIVVIKNISGTAMAVAAALDAMDNKDILGTIAGDDTVICVTKTNEKADIVVEKLGKLKKDIKR